MSSGSKANKATMFIQIFPCIGINEIPVKHLIGAVPISGAGREPEYLSSFKPGNNIGTAQADCICLAFDILPEDFFLCDGEGLEAFLSHSVKPERIYHLRCPPQATSEQNDSGQEQRDVCVRVSLLPIPKAKENTKCGNDVAGGYFKKVKDFAKRFKHRFLI